MTAKEKILKRLSHIMDLIKHPNTPEDERENALVHLRNLMAKHNIDESEIGDNDDPDQLYWELTQSSYKWQVFLGAALSEIFGYKAFTPAYGRKRNVLIVICKPEEAETHSQVFYSLKNQPTL